VFALSRFAWLLPTLDRLLGAEGAPTNSAGVAEVRLPGLVDRAHLASPYFFPSCLIFIRPFRKAMRMAPGLLRMRQEDNNTYRSIIQLATLGTLVKHQSFSVCDWFRPFVSAVSGRVTDISGVFYFTRRLRFVL
jgi:hypothetical protein